MNGVKRDKSAWLSVDYDDSTQESFKGLKLSIMKFATGDEIEVINFNTGDPLVDWYNYYKFVYGGEAYDKGIFTIGGSSNTDHWFMDGDKYREQYLKPINGGEALVFMTQEEIDQLSLDDMNHTIKCVITKDIKSFEELKIYVNTYNSAHNQI